MVVIGKLQNFNRIISLTFYKGTLKQLEIRCPTKGIKPDIEITATYGADTELLPFTITIKNLYLDLSGDQYTALKVKAGYENNSVEFTGTIQTLYQEEPGPEGKTVIQCNLGIMTNWLGAYGQFTYETGTPLITVLEAIKAKLGSGLHVGNYAKTLKLKTPFEYDGTARGAMAKLASLFDDEGLVVYVTQNVLCAICMTKGDYFIKRQLKYMSAPPQPNAGDDKGSYYTVLTAPWDPSIMVGDLLIVPARVYIRDYSAVNMIKKTQVIQVQTISFHFGTKGQTNTMTIEGFEVG